MDVSSVRTSQPAPPQFADGAAGVPDTTQPAGGWKSLEVGAAELAQVAGEEAVDEESLRRDDELGKLMSKAFDRLTAAAALPPLGKIAQND